jgi:hypothetical protein
MIFEFWVIIFASKINISIQKIIDWVLRPFLTSVIQYKLLLW